VFRHLVLVTSFRHEENEAAEYYYAGNVGSQFQGCKILGLSKARIVGSNPAQGINIRAFYCAGRSSAIGRSPFQGILQKYLMIFSF